MQKLICVFLYVMATAVILSGCYRPNEVSSIAADSDTKAADASVTSVSPQSSTSFASEPTQPAQNEDSKLTTKATTTTKANTSATKSKSTTTASTYQIHSGERYEWILQCINYNFNYQILKKAVDSTLSSSEMAKLKSDVAYYRGIDGAGGDFTEDFTGIINEDLAINKSKSFIKSIFGFTITSQTPDVMCRDYTNRPSNEWLMYNKQYEIVYAMKSPSADIKNLHYAITLDAVSGRCVGGSYRKQLNAQPDIQLDRARITDSKIKEMQERAKDFVTRNNLVPGEKIVYTYSELTAMDQPAPDADTTTLQTLIYFSNGEKIGLYESYVPGYVLYFTISKTHGFRS